MLEIKTAHRSIVTFVYCFCM